MAVGFYSKAFSNLIKDFSLKSQRRMQLDAQRGKWYKYDGRRTICGRQVMALWHTFQCFQGDRALLPYQEA